MGSRQPQVAKHAIAEFSSGSPDTITGSEVSLPDGTKIS
jgi:hypothetical protein